MGIDKEIKEIANQIRILHGEAYREYLEPVEILCANPDASENEVGLMLDYLLEFCGNDKVLDLYKRVCRAFYTKYPECIARYIMWYREEYENEKLSGEFAAIASKN
jgi:hypothetical protein